MAGYGSDAGLSAWLTDNGYTLPVGAPSLAVLRQRGSAYLDATYAAKLTCSYKTGGIDQERQWPRTGAFVYGGPAIDANAIPLAWVNASYRAAWLEASSPGVLTVTINPSSRVKMQKVDTLAREFFEGGAAGAGLGGLSVIDAEIDGLVGPYLCAYLGFAAFVV